MNIYARVVPDRLAEVSEAVGNMIGLAPEMVSENALCMHPLAVGAEGKGPNPSYIKESGPKLLVEAGGIEPPSEDNLPRISTHVAHALISPAGTPTGRMPDGLSPLKSYPCPRGLETGQLT